MALTIIDNASGIDVFVHVCGEKMTLRATILTILSHVTRDVSVFVKCDNFWTVFWKLPQIRTSDFRMVQVVRQHAEGMVGSII